MVGLLKEGALRGTEGDCKGDKEMRFGDDVAASAVIQVQGAVWLSPRALCLGWAAHLFPPSSLGALVFSAVNNALQASRDPFLFFFSFSFFLLLFFLLSVRKYCHDRSPFSSVFYDLP